MTGQRLFQQVSDDNLARLTGYIGRLRDAGLRLPAHAGSVNKTAVARACGFARETFQQNARFAATLDAAIEQLGIELPASEAAPERNSDDKARILRLEQQLAASRSEAHELRRRIRRYDAIAEHMAATGRRVEP